MKSITIKTLYDIGDSVYLVRANGIQRVTISTISLHICKRKGKKITQRYLVKLAKDCFTYVKSDDIFKNEIDAFRSLQCKINIIKK